MNSIAITTQRSLALACLLLLPGCGVVRHFFHGLPGGRFQAHRAYESDYSAPPPGNYEREYGPPPVVGSQLGVRPGETVVERSLELKNRLASAEQQNDILEAHLDELQESVETRRERIAQVLQRTEDPQAVRRVMEILAETPEPNASSDSSLMLAMHMQDPDDDTLEAAEPVEDDIPEGESLPLPFGDDPRERDLPQMAPTLVPGPAVSGRRLGILPGSTATERSLQLLRELRMAKKQNDELRLTIRRQQGMIDLQRKKLLQATDELRASRDELAEVRALLGQWTRELQQVRDKAEQAEKENQETLHAIITLLEELLGEDHPGIPRTQ